MTFKTQGMTFKTQVVVCLEGSKGEVYWDNSYIPRKGDTLRIARELWTVTDVIYETIRVEIHARAKKQRK